MAIVEQYNPKLDREREAYVLLSYAARRAGIKKEHYSTQRDEVMEWAAETVRINEENPYIWPDEKTILFMASANAYITSGQSPDYPVYLLNEEYGIGRTDEPEVDSPPDSSEYADEILSDPDLKDNQSIDLTGKLKSEYFDKWIIRPPLRKTRAKFSVYKGNEKPYQICVTELSSDQFRTVFYSTAFCKRVSGGSLLVFPRDPDENAIHHEYIHSQWRDLSGGVEYHSLFRGLEEAYVERSTPDPSSYEAQRSTFDLISEHIPNFPKLVHQAGTAPLSRGLMLKAILKKFGLPGVNIISRYSPINGMASAEFYTADQKRIFIPASQAQRELRVIQ